MALFTDKSEFICSEETFKALMNREYVPNFYGYFHHSYCGSQRRGFYELLLEMLVRGVSYIVRRDLKCHFDFYKIIELYPELKENVKDYQEMIKMKFSDVPSFEEHLRLILEDKPKVNLIN